MPDNRITRAAARLRAAKAHEAALKEGLKLVEAQIADLEQRELPAAFTEFGVGASLALEDGAVLSRKLEVTGSLPKEDAERRARGLQWARENDFSNTIRCVVAASFAAGDEDKARALYERLRGDNAATVIMTENIHHSTLQAIGRDRAQRGLPTPFEDLGLNIVRKVTVSEPRRSRTEESQ